MPLFNRIQSLVYLPVGQQSGAERRAIRPDFPLGFQLFQRGEHIVARQVADAGIVQLIQVNVVRIQAAQASSHALRM